MFFGNIYIRILIAKGIIMIFNIYLLVLGFVLLIKGADIFVSSAASIAQRFKVAKVFVGLTIVAFGTSAPEFAISMNAFANGNTDMVIGNVIGSNILNVLLILGIATMIRPLVVKKSIINKGLPLVMLISTILSVLFLDVKMAHGVVNQITRSDGVVIFLFFIIFLYYLMSLTKQKKEEKKVQPQISLVKSIVVFIFGLAGVIVGSNLIVESTAFIAKNVGISERIIGLTIIAIGTSLPELVTTIVSSRKGEQDLLIGSIIGSNIFNICVVLGIPVIIYGTLTPASFQTLDLIMLIGSSILLFIFAKTKEKITRIEGAILFTTFVFYYLLVFIIK